MRVFICLWVALLCSGGFGSTYFVEKTAGALGPETGHTVQELVRSSLGELGQDVSLDPLKAEFQVRPVVLSLGSNLIVTLEKRRREALVFSAKLKALSVEELDTIVHRLTRAVVFEKMPKDDVRVDEVSEDEATRGTHKKAARRGTFFGLGPAFVTNLNESGIGYYFTLGYAWDIGPAYIRLSTELFGKDGAIGFLGGIGASYFLTDQDFSPFVGADLSFGIAKVDPDGIGSTFDSDLRTVGFALGPVVGIQMWRTSSVNLEIAFRLAFFLSKTRLGNPMFSAIRVGLYF